MVSGSRDGSRALNRPDAFHLIPDQSRPVTSCPFEFSLPQKERTGHNAVSVAS